MSADKVKPDSSVNMPSMNAEAVTVHEIFSSYVAAGFTRAEALQILLAHMTQPGKP